MPRRVACPRSSVAPRAAPRCAAYSALPRRGRIEAVQARNLAPSEGPCLGARRHCRGARNSAM
eukprot:5975908-Lingulodinium_polyedra.AAC.1